jgi:5'-3' exonuclease
MKYLLIDGNNLAVRCAFANQELTNHDGIPTSVHYGFLNSLMSLKEQYTDYQFLIVWDGKSKRRIREASSAVKSGIIKSGYKENRDKENQPQPLLDFYAQSPYLKRGLEQTGIPQIRLEDFEADDIIASYCKYLKDHEIVMVTSDKDYFQLLDNHIGMWDGMKQKLFTADTFKEEYKIEPTQHIDCGALMGDSSDNIFGVPGWGEKSALEAIQKYGNWRATIDHLKKMYSEVRKEYPDVKGDDFERLRNIRTPKEEEKFKKGDEWKGKYPEIIEGMPFTGVALAFEDKKWKPTKELKKGLKNNLLALMFEERIELAYSLKKMDTNIEGLPNIEPGKFNKERLMEYLNYYDIESIRDDIEIFKN